MDPGFAKKIMCVDAIRWFGMVKRLVLTGGGMVFAMMMEVEAEAQLGGGSAIFFHVRGSGEAGDCGDRGGLGFESGGDAML